MRKSHYSFSLAALMLAGLAVPIHADTVPVHTKTFISDPVTVDRVYKTMQGPFIRQNIKISDEPGPGELLWLKGVKLEFIDGKDDSPRGMNHLCHSHIGQPEKSKPILFSLIQGQNVIELPGNLGIPVLSNASLEYAAQILNLHQVEKPFDLRTKITLDYVRDADLTGTMKPLREIFLTLNIPIDEKTAEMIAAHPEGCNASLASKDGSIEIVPSSDLTVRKAQGEYLSYHWYVPPGKHTYSYEIPEEIRKRVDGKATIHFATVHLHPYGRSMELFDLTTNTRLLKIDVKNFPENGGIEHVNHFQSEEGVPFDPDHQYRVSAEYDNTTDESVDAMAMLFVYIHEEK